MYERSDDAGGLFSADGRRLYLCAAEGVRFLAAARRADPRTRAFCQVLAYAGCRISESLEVTPRRLDVEAGKIVFRTLKRRRCVYRAVPIPDDLMAELQALAAPLAPEARLWPWCRQTGWRRVKTVMAEAGVAGAQASPKGLRHRFGLNAAEHGVPPIIAGRWMGHASLRSTAIYQQAVGEEERRLAERLW